MPASKNRWGDWEAVTTLPVSHLGAERHIRMATFKTAKGFLATTFTVGRVRAPGSFEVAYGGSLGDFQETFRGPQIRATEKAVNAQHVAQNALLAEVVQRAAVHYTLNAEKQAAGDQEYGHEIEAAEELESMGGPRA